MTVFINGIGYHLGCARHISDISCSKSQETGLEVIKQPESGMGFFCETKLSLSELCSQAIKKCLNSSTIDSHSIDALFVASSNYEQLGHLADEMNKIKADTGIEGAYPHFIGLSQCNNFHSALDLSKSLLEANKYLNIMIVTLDKAYDDDSRVILGGLAVGSDGAAATILSRASGQLKVVFSAKRTDRRLSEFKGDIDKHFHFKIMTEAFVSMCDKYYESTGAPASDADLIIFNNYHYKFLEFLLFSIGLDINKVYVDGIFNYGHANASDNLINLFDILSMQRRTFYPGDRALLFGSGTDSWGLTVVERQS